MHREPEEEGKINWKSKWGGPAEVYGLGGSARKQEYKISRTRSSSVLEKSLC